MNCRRPLHAPACLPADRSRLRFSSATWLAILVSMIASLATPLRAQSLNECKELLRTGQYEACIDATQAALLKRAYGEDFPVIKAKAELLSGRYAQSLSTIESGLERYGWSIRLRLLQLEALRFNGRENEVLDVLTEIDQMVSASPWRYTDADDLVVLGDAALIVGADAKDVLEGFYDRARSNFSSHAIGHIATARLALEKGDRGFAAEMLRPAVERFDDNAELKYLLAMAVKPTAPEEAEAMLNGALEINPNHIPTLLFQVEQLIDREDYDRARTFIDRALAVNPWHPSAHAYRAVIAHLQSDAESEARSRSAALAWWPRNPEVDHVIGKRLSRKYRFREGATHQQLALLFDPAFAEAQIQLSEDLLRLGEEEAGWQMAETAHKNDGYNVTLFNLLQLKDHIATFRTIETSHFRIRMSATEADIYGTRVGELLEEAFENLCPRYGLEITEPVIVEIFPQPQDFAVRTFGMPDVAGFLGVCFGKVITANSPASQRENRSNWESVLWHEFCHVVTLQLTENRMPRWLSEGISVYEERRRDPRWGQRMNPTFRRMIRDGELTPVDELSGAFLSPPSGMHLQFAYFESSLVVEYLVDEFGFDALVAVLNDLQRGIAINDALSRHTNGIEQFRSDFEAFVKQRAEAFAPDASFDADELADLLTDDGNALELFVDANPDNVPASITLAQQQIEQGDNENAVNLLRAVIKRYPDDESPSGARPILARLFLSQGLESEAADVLIEHIEHSADDYGALEQLLNLQLRSTLR